MLVAMPRARTHRQHKKARVKRRNCDGGWCEHHSTTPFERGKKNNQSRMWNNITTSDFIWCAPRFWLHIVNDFTFQQNSITNLKHFISRYLQSSSLCLLNHNQHFWTQLAKTKPKNVTTKTIWKSLKKVIKTAHFKIHHSFYHLIIFIGSSFKIFLEVLNARPTHTLKGIFIMKFCWSFF